MPSSTSSSEARSWGRTWLVAAGLALILLGGWELFWRGRGFVPTPRDDAALWALARSRVSGAGPDAVVFVGSSRLQVAIDPEAFRAASGWAELHQLAIQMGAPGPVLRDLADDDRFGGRVVVGVNPLLAFAAEPWMGFAARGYLKDYAASTPADGVEARLRLGAQSALVLGLPPLHPARILEAGTRGTWPRPQRVRADAARFARGDFDSRHVAEAAARRRAAWEARPTQPPGPAAFRARIRSYADAVRDIRARGGDAVFVRMPAAGAVLEFEERTYPRARYWDVFAREVGAVAIHFEDHPELRGHRIPDGSHLDGRSRAAFSRGLARLLVEAFGRRPGASGELDND